jgi:propionyl-CoA synthetase
VKDSLKGELPLAFLVLNARVDANPKALVADVVARVREQIGPVAAFKQACVVSRLPKTRSGKILRGTMSKIADSEPYRTPPTIEDPSSLDEIRDALEALGYAKQT